MSSIWALLNSKLGVEMIELYWSISAKDISEPQNALRKWSGSNGKNKLNKLFNELLSWTGFATGVVKILFIKS
jgi:hypothetical protein